MKHTINNTEYTLSMTDAQDNVIIASVGSVVYWNPSSEFDCKKLPDEDINYLIPHLNEIWRKAQEHLEEERLKHEQEEKRKLILYPTYIREAVKVESNQGFFYAIKHRNLGRELSCIMISHDSNSEFRMSHEQWYKSNRVRLTIKEQ